jgi:hypothetical protein
MDFVTSDTEIFNGNKINNLLILLKQAIRGTVRQNQFDSTACVGLVETAEFRRCTDAAGQVASGEGQVCSRSGSHLLVRVLPEFGCKPV